MKSLEQKKQKVKIDEKEIKEIIWALNIIGLKKDEIAYMLTGLSICRNCRCKK